MSESPLFDLSSVSFDSTISIFGPTGSGKSTIVQALLRQYIAKDPTLNIMYVSEIGRWNDLSRSAIASASKARFKRVVFVVEEGARLEDLLQSPSFHHIVANHRALQIGLIVTGLQASGPQWPPSIQRNWDIAIQMNQVPASLGRPANPHDALVTSRDGEEFWTRVNLPPAVTDSAVVDDSNA